MRSISAGSVTSDGGPADHPQRATIVRAHGDPNAAQSMRNPRLRCKAEFCDYAADSWTALIDRDALRYWDLSDPAYATIIEGWRSAPEAFVSLTLVPDSIRSGA